ncbi:MAG TPA: hypothetical protein VFY71_04995 [Planctomycetota bacterium]|nr:hypothetical protein [Planctomycetota bacterium]
MRHVLSLALVLFLAAAASAQWTDLGNGLAGTSGVPPVLTGLGPLVPTAGTKISVDGGPASSPGYLLLGMSAANLPFKGGVLVPNPDVLGIIAFDAAGSFAVIFSWPTDVPANTSMWWQCWAPDAGGPQGFAASNALLSVSN